MDMTSIVFQWGSTEAERNLAYPCDGLLENPEAVYFRAVSVQAPAEVLFRWLCQLKVAPYSYDWLDNGFRRSPRSLTPGAENLAVGDAVMTIFRLVDFEPGKHLTIVMQHPGAIRIFGHLVITYMVRPQADGCRLIVKALIRYPQTGVWRLMRWFLPWGDLIMMRKQFLTFRALAERGLRRR